MVYEFAAKIKNMKNEKMFDPDLLSKNIIDLSPKFQKPMDILILQSNDIRVDRSILVKSQASVSTLPGFHDTELSETIESFKKYLSDIAAMVYGDISESEAFYNNSKMFSRLYL